MLIRPWTAIKNWSWWLMWGWVWSSMLSYFIRVQWRPEVFARLPPHDSVVFILVLWLLVTVFIVRPECLKRAKERGDEA